MIVPDKGPDRVFVFRFDADSGQFHPGSPPFVTSAAGAGPRHVAFHPTQRWAYVVNELDSTISVYAFETGGAGMAPLQTVASVPEDIGVRNTGSEILVHPSGRHVYVSNRGHDSVGVFAIDDADGLLRAGRWFPTGGKTPRAMEFDPTGSYLYVANQASDTIVPFRVGAHDGGLARTGNTVSTGSPSSIAFLA